MKHTHSFNKTRTSLGLDIGINKKKGKEMVDYVISSDNNHLLQP